MTAARGAALRNVNCRVHHAAKRSSSTAQARRAGHVGASYSGFWLHPAAGSPLRRDARRFPAAWIPCRPKKSICVANTQRGPPLAC